MESKIRKKCEMFLVHTFINLPLSFSTVEKIIFLADLVRRKIKTSEGKKKDKKQTKTQQPLQQSKKREKDCTKVVSIGGGERAKIEQVKRVRCMKKREKRRHGEEES